MKFLSSVSSVFRVQCALHYLRGAVGSVMSSGGSASGWRCCPVNPVELDNNAQARAEPGPSGQPKYFRDSFVRLPTSLFLSKSPHFYCRNVHSLQTPGTVRFLLVQYGRRRRVVHLRHRPGQALHHQRSCTAHKMRRRTAVPGRGLSCSCTDSKARSEGHPVCDQSSG